MFFSAGAPDVIELIHAVFRVFRQIVGEGVGDGQKTDPASGDGRCRTSILTWEEAQKHTRRGEQCTVTRTL